MTDIEYRVADLINFSSNQKPIDFEQAFKNVINTKVSDAIEAKKAAVAQFMFAADDKDEVEEDINAEVA